MTKAFSGLLRRTTESSASRYVMMPKKFFFLAAGRSSLEGYLGREDGSYEDGSVTYLFCRANGSVRMDGRSPPHAEYPRCCRRKCDADLLLMPSPSVEKNSGQAVTPSFEMPSSYSLKRRK